MPKILDFLDYWRCIAIGGHSLKRTSDENASRTLFRCCTAAEECSGSGGRQIRSVPKAEFSIKFNLQLSKCSAEQNRTSQHSTRKIGCSSDWKERRGEMWGSNRGKYIFVGFYLYKANVGQKYIWNCVEVINNLANNWTQYLRIATNFRAGERRGIGIRIGNGVVSVALTDWRPLYSGLEIAFKNCGLFLIASAGKPVVVN